MRRRPARTAARVPSATMHASARPRRRRAQADLPSRKRRRLRAQDDLERRTETRPRGQGEATLDVLRARADVLQALPGGGRLSVESFAVVAHGHEALAVAHPDDDLGLACIRVLADVGETLLNDAEDLDLLVGRQPDGGIDLEVDLEPAVG